MSLDPSNRLLNSLDAAVFERLAPYLKRCDLMSGQVLFEADAAVDQVYFPETSLVASIIVDVSGHAVLTEIVGRDGAVGLIEALSAGERRSSVTVQIAGAAWRITAREFRCAFEDCPGLKAAIHRHLERMLLEARQSAACCVLHTTQQRLSRWLLVCDELVGAPSRLPLTQEVIATLLGVQRTTVTKLAGDLQAAGLIKRRRAQIEILDRAGLERSSCECFNGKRKDQTRLSLHHRTPVQ